MHYLLLYDYVENAVEAFVAKDPYVAAGLVARWRVRPWTVVIGGLTGGA